MTSYDHTNLPAQRLNIPAVIAEYRAKRYGGDITIEQSHNVLEVVETYLGVDAELAAFDHACSKLAASCSMHSNSYTGEVLWGRNGRPTPNAKQVGVSLLKSAWRRVYTGLNIDKIAPAGDITRFEALFASPPELSLESIREHFGFYILDTRQHILRGLAEQFVDLDPIFRSHEKMKIGVKGLPKRIILRSFGEYYSGHGSCKLKDVIRAINTYLERPNVDHSDYQKWCEYHAGVQTFRATRFSAGQMVEHEGSVWVAKQYIDAGPFNPDNWNLWVNPLPDLELRLFQNGNAHVYFAPSVLKAVNLALAEYYGEVLPDCPEAAPQEGHASTEVCKDLQFYPTPEVVADRLCYKSDFRPGDDGICRVLDPSCGEGAILEAVERYAKNENNSYYCQQERVMKQPRIVTHGIEVHAERAAISRSKGFHIQEANFLQLKPQPIFDVILINPPYYGKHYQKHIDHARKFLKKLAVSSTLFFQKAP